jgi:hypothetical protein
MELFSAGTTMNTPGLALAATLALSANAVFATDFDNRAHASNVTGLPWRNAPAEADSFAGVVATAGGRSWAAPVAAGSAGVAPVDTFEATAGRRAGTEDAPPVGAQVASVDADALSGLAPVPEPDITTLLLSGLCALGLLGMRRGLH